MGTTMEEWEHLCEMSYHFIDPLLNFTQLFGCDRGTHFPHLSYSWLQSSHCSMGTTAVVRGWFPLSEPLPPSPSLLLTAVSVADTRLGEMTQLGGVIETWREGPAEALPSHTHTCTH